MKEMFKKLGVGGKQIWCITILSLTILQMLRIDGKLSCTRGSSIIVAANYTRKTLEQVSNITLSSEMLKKITRTITGLICSMLQHLQCAILPVYQRFLFQMLYKDIINSVWNAIR